MKAFIWKSHCVVMLLITFLPCLLSAQKIHKGIKKQFIQIPAGQCKTELTSIQTTEFYIAKEEVSCQAYKNFIAEMKSAKPEEIYKLEMDTTVWSWMKEYQQTYGRHPAFDAYPIVGVSKFAAEEYCHWLTQKYGNGIWEFRLPTHQEWMRAAQGKQDGVPYPGGKTTFDGFKLTKGKRAWYKYNFADWYGLENLQYNDSTKTYSMKGRTSFRDNFDFQAPPDNYFPKNDFGLYHMNGNVAELVSDADIAVGGSWKSYGYDVRVESSKPYVNPTDDIGFRPVMVRKN